MYDLEGKTALVTGAGGRHGLGRAIASRLAREGADVAVNDLRAAPEPVSEGGWRGAESTAAEITDLGRRSAAFFGDISDAETVDHIVGQTIEALGGIDVFVANAGSKPGPDRVPVVDLAEDAFDLVQRVNVKGTFLCCRAVARHMLARGGGGRIIIMSSAMGKRGLPRSAAYTASKFALGGLTQCLAHELAPDGITVNAVCPGTIETERLLDIASGKRADGETAEQHLQKMLEKQLAQTPLGRLGTADDIANLVTFLASDQAAFMTGLSISVSGGAVMI
ncbi:MAG: SDR family oxidoreductase [Roseitalea sp.]|nr:SDR family oxidoreductase [Roseitalea sp.]MBO6721207.1 SDR family oxidoreductase [Roseitalea sp.]MBO6744265.1 SDR family oxidoreductase [Roseitalea sp.]